MMELRIKNPIEPPSHRSHRHQIGAPSLEGLIARLASNSSKNPKEMLFFICVPVPAPA